MLTGQPCADFTELGKKWVQLTGKFSTVSTAIFYRPPLTFGLKILPTVGWWQAVSPLRAGGSASMAFLPVTTGRWLNISMGRPMKSQHSPLPATANRGNELFAA